MKWSHLISLSLAIAGVLAPCWAAHGDQTLAQYSETAWGHKDGLPSTFIYAVTQTTDGFLWLGTADGLVRFDGVQFTRWRPAMPNDQVLGQVRVLSVSRHGDLLLGTGTGMLGRMGNGDLKITQLYAAVESIQESRDGSLWVATDAALWHIDEASLQPVEPSIAMPKGRLSGPLRDSDGREWITTEQGIFYVDAGRLAPSRDLRSWLFRRQDGHLALLDAHGRVHSLHDEETGGSSSNLLPYSSTIIQVTADSSGCLWIASRGNGVIRLAAAGGRTTAERFTRAQGLSSDFARSLFEDREHNLWVATDNGLNRLRRNNVLSLTRRHGLLSDIVTSIGAGKDGSVWLATPDGLERLRDETHTVYLKGSDVLSLLVGRDQSIWAGTTRGLMQWRDGKITFAPGDVRFSAVTVLAEDGAGTLWFYDGSQGIVRQQPGHDPVKVTDGSLVHRAVTSMYGGHGDEVWFGLANGNLVEYREGAFHTYSNQDGLPGGAIHGLSGGPAGEIWVATELGLCFFTGSHVDCWNAQNGLPGDRILWAVPDHDGSLWLGYNFGVARMNAEQLRDAAKTGSAKPHWKLFDDGDGIENSPDLEGNAPAVVAQDGRLWLTTSEGVAVIDPKNLRPNLLPPPVRILGLQADGQEIDLSRPVRLQPLTRSIQFSFTGLSLSDPRRMRFRYRLDGFDLEWRDGGARRDAFYTNLPPGSYAFRVRAANNDGVWNDTGATLHFVLAPAYFQTVWFRLLCLGAVLFSGAFLFRARLLSVRRSLQLRFAERMEERMRIAQDIHDHLIQEMVGISMQLEVADELTPGGAGAKKPLQRALILSRSAIASGRLTLQSLRSRLVTGSGLVETLKRTAEAYPEKNGMAVEYVVEGEERLLQPAMAEDLSELGREALRNALKHAGNGAIRVHLRYGSSSLELSVSDDGGGVEDAVLQAGVPGHYGLAGMRERAARMSAELTIHSTPNQGTTVLVSVPANRAYQETPGSDTASLRSIFRHRRGHSISRQEKTK